MSPFDGTSPLGIPVVSSDNYAGGVLAAKPLAKTGAKDYHDYRGMTIRIPQLVFAMLALFRPDTNHQQVSSDWSPIRKEMKSRPSY